MTQISDDLFLGAAAITLINPAPDSTDQATDNNGGRGVGPMGRNYTYDLTPVALLSTNLVSAVAVAASGSVAITAGTGVTQGVNAAGSTIYKFDAPRGVQLVSSGAGDTTQVITVSGTDYYGQAMSQAVTLNGTTIVYSTKAFASITGISASAALAGNLSVGSSDVFGLPFRVLDTNHVISVKWASALAQDAGTFTAADTTATATTTTGDVRGTYKPSSASNGTRRLTITIFIPGIGSGPNATRVGALGVTQA
jgi:hypothetical protein